MEHVLSANDKFGGKVQVVSGTLETQQRATHSLNAHSPSLNSSFSDNA